jgi:signal transduction histidine kinase
MEAAQDDPSLHSIAGLLDSEIDRIIDRYEQDLQSMGSRLLQDPTTRIECFRQARGIIADLSRYLRDEGACEMAVGLSLSKEIGVSRASHSIHPSESLRAAIALFEAITSTCAELLSRYDVPARDLLSLALATNKLVSQRIRMAAGSYMGYLLESIEQVHFTERKRISRELHDRIGGNIAAAHRQVELFKAMRPEVPDEAAARVDAAEETLRLALDDLRRLISDLRIWEPEGSLETSLSSYIQNSLPSGMNYSLSVNGDEFNLSPEIRGEVFLIIREAIRNAINHARATRMLAQVNITPNEIYAFIEDNGIGLAIDPNKPSACDAGISSMRERAALMEGELIIMSHPGRGTRVELLIPLRQGAGGLDG